jgi:hypothetical protein
VERAAVGQRRQQDVGGPEVVVWGEGQGAAAALLVEVGDEVVVGRAEVGLVGGGSEMERKRERERERENVFEENVFEMKFFEFRSATREREK